MNFLIYDIVLLVSFVVFTVIFLYKRRTNLKRDGLLFLYKTKVGMRIINNIGKKYKKTLNLLSYVSVILGFMLMFGGIYIFGKTLWVYIFEKEIVSLLKVPPIMPLLPYLPQVFKIAYLPSFYFIYWIVILAIVAVTHEFSHGIFAINKKVKVKSTGFGFFPFFFPVFLAAFVELDEKKMEKKKIFSQMAVLSAGTFANVLVAIISFVLLFAFFSLSFSPSGVIFDSYTYSLVGVSAITSLNGQSVGNLTYSQIMNLTIPEEINNISTEKASYLAQKESLASQEDNAELGFLILYNDAPAIRANLSNTIVKINGVTITSKEKLGEELARFSPGDSVIITMLEDDAFRDYEIQLGKDPDTNKTYLGIGFLQKESSGILGKIVQYFSSFKKEEIYYIPKFQAAEFIYYLLWWLVMINFSVALVNMLPVGIFDGGRFFYLAMLAITKSEKKSKKIFSIITYLFLAAVFVMMVFWAISLF